MATTQPSTRRLYRHLLRECSYLPDSWTRQWTRQHVIWRFRRYQDKVLKANPELMLKNAKQQLSTLKRANQGEHKALLKVLLLAYGRTGRRRHELLDPLLPNATQRQRETWLRQNIFAGSRPDDATFSEALSALSSPASEEATEENIKHLAGLSTLLYRLGKSQIGIPFPTIRNVLRRVDPNVPELNSQQRPLSPKRRKKMIGRGYADFLDKLHAPLPAPEWDRLRCLASGEVQEVIPERRPGNEIPQSALQAVLANDKLGSRKAFGDSEAANITPRIMQRIYATVFDVSNKILWQSKGSDSDTNWHIVWGIQHHHLRTEDDQQSSQLSGSGPG